MTSKIKSSLFVSFASVVLFAVYPILVLFSNNKEEVNFEHIVLPILCSLVLAFLIFFLLFLFFKEAYKTSIASISFLFIFFFYGLVYSSLSNLLSLEHWHLLPSLLFTWIYFVILLKKVNKLKILNDINTIILIPLLALSLFNVVNILSTELSFEKAEISIHESDNKNILVETSSSDDYPDILLIILDEMASFETIRQEWGYNPSQIINYLKNKNVYLAEDSEVRYVSTNWSVPNLLNLDYLTSPIDKDNYLNCLYHPEKLIETETAETCEILKDLSYDERAEKWNNNSLMKFLKQKGYYISVLEGVTQHYHVDFDLADSHYSFDDINKSMFSVDAFVLELIRRSALLPFNFLLKLDQAGGKNYVGNKYIFDYLSAGQKKIEKPHFTLAHILCPHAPHVFDSNGDYLYTKHVNNPKSKMANQKFNDNEAYLNQYKYVISEIYKIMDANIKEDSGANPIIIIQSDHGPRPRKYFMKDKKHVFKIFNAIYFPDHDYEDFYQEIGQINTLRVMLNKYFGTDLEMLENR